MLQICSQTGLLISDFQASQIHGLHPWPRRTPQAAPSGLSWQADHMENYTKADYGKQDFSELESRKNLNKHVQFLLQSSLGHSVSYKKQWRVRERAEKREARSINLAAIPPCINMSQDKWKFCPNVCQSSALNCSALKNNFLL